jgi:hypothetical protein
MSPADQAAKTTLFARGARPPRSTSVAWRMPAKTTLFVRPAQWGGNAADL